MMYDEETDSLRPSVVSDPLKVIWLNVGDPEFDCAFKELDEVTWCDDAQFPSDIKYVLHSDHEAALAEAVAKERPAPMADMVPAEELVKVQADALEHQAQEASEIGEGVLTGNEVAALLKARAAAIRAALGDR